MVGVFSVVCFLAIRTRLGASRYCAFFFWMLGYGLNLFQGYFCRLFGGYSNRTFPALPWFGFFELILATSRLSVTSQNVPDFSQVAITHISWLKFSFFCGNFPKRSVYSLFRVGLCLRGGLLFKSRFCTYSFRVLGFEYPVFFSRVISNSLANQPTVQKNLRFFF